MKRISRTGHADATSPLGKKLRVPGGGILYASIAMVDRVEDVYFMPFVEVKGLFERRETALHFKCRVQAVPPRYNGCMRL
ncbi:hypothetical protein JT26_00255 [Porphyromonas sp. COT-108 OH1349]|nr:hypothetical protein JT26_00255 [Porphyromonas sp. COT-108 OH1349]